MASLDDILTVQKNGVVALGNLNQATLRDAGTNTSATVTSSTVIYVGPGRVVNYAVVIAGTGAGGVYNASTTAGANASNQLCSIPTTVGVFPTGQTFSNGLVITPGAGQSINVTYSPG